MRLIIAGGGTGGHLFPGMAVAEEFLARDPANEVLFVGTERGIEARAVPAAGYRLELISAAGVRGKGGLGQVKAIAMLLYGYSQSRKIIKAFLPDAILGVGGYASLPMVMAGRGSLIPTYIHEQNAIPGMTNKLLARFAGRVFITLDESAHYFPKEKVLLTGNPLRRQILDSVATVKAGSTDGSRSGFHVLVFGGSQGAHAINTAMIAAAPLLSGIQGLTITHQTGEKDQDAVKQAYAASGIAAEVRTFIADMAAEYRRADLVICRAGATTIAEVTACGKTCLFIPFPHAVDDHQRRNAEALLKKGACLLMLEQELTPESLARAITDAMADPGETARMGAAAAGLAQLDAARVIVDEIIGREEPVR